MHTSTRARLARFPSSGKVDNLPPPPPPPPGAPLRDQRTAPRVESKHFKGLGENQRGAAVGSSHPRRGRAAGGVGESPLRPPRDAGGANAHASLRVGSEPNPRPRTRFARCSGGHTYRHGSVARARKSPGARPAPIRASLRGGGRGGGGGDERADDAAGPRSPRRGRRDRGQRAERDRATQLRRDRGSQHAHARPRAGPRLAPTEVPKAGAERDWLAARAARPCPRRDAHRPARSLRTSPHAPNLMPARAFGAAMQTRRARSPHARRSHAASRRCGPTPQAPPS